MAFYINLWYCNSYSFIFQSQPFNYNVVWCVFYTKKVIAILSSVYISTERVISVMEWLRFLLISLVSSLDISVYPLAIILWDMHLVIRMLIYRKTSVQACKYLCLSFNIRNYKIFSHTFSGTFLLKYLSEEYMICTRHIWIYPIHQ